MAQASETPSESHQLVSRLSFDGYGLEIQGYNHRASGDKEAMVFLPNDTTYRIRVSNANDHVCMVSLVLDDFNIGTFLLHPFTKCDIERPTDRPLGFMFMQDPLPSDQNGGTGTTAKTKKSGSVTKGKNRPREQSHIHGVFKPETGGKIIQVDVNAEHLNRTQRLELLTDISVSDLFEVVRKDFGDWTMGSTCALIHWTSAEYDSPVEDILKPTVQTALRNFRHQEDPIRKMSFLAIDHVELHIEGHEVVTYSVDKVPTFEKALAVASESLVPVEGTEAVIYFLSISGRFLCSSDWVKGITPIFQVMHRDEIIGKPGTLVLRITLDAPPQIKHVIARMLNDGTQRLQVVPETTLRECRVQLEAMGGPWGEDPRWLFGGTLMENGRSIGFYGIGHMGIIDVVPRLQDVGTFRSLEMKDPIAVDGDKPVNTAEMIRREESRNKALADAEKKNKKARRGGTTLRGRSKQQYIEVDPVETDERFVTKLTISILFKDKEEEILASLNKPAKTKGKRCTVS